MESAARAGHSAPMPMPSRARKIARNKNVGEKPAMKFATEYQRIEIINGILRPTPAASHPEATAPTSRSHKVIVNTKATSVIGTPNSWEIGTMINKKIVKSNASRVQPSHAAHHAIHWSFVGSFHHGICPVVSAAVLMPFLLLIFQQWPKGLGPPMTLGHGVWLNEREL